MEVNKSPNLTPMYEKFERNSFSNEQLVYQALRLVGAASRSDLMSWWDETCDYILQRNFLNLLNFRFNFFKNVLATIPKPTKCCRTQKTLRWIHRLVWITIASTIVTRMSVSCVRHALAKKTCKICIEPFENMPDVEILKEFFRHEIISLKTLRGNCQSITKFQRDGSRRNVIIIKNGVKVL